MPTSPHHRGRCWAAGCVGAALTACAGCGGPLCPSTTYAASISVGLDPGWASPGDLVVTVSCPEDVATGCGFLDGPVHASGSASVLVHTVLRPAEVEVVVSAADTGAVVAADRFPVVYEPLGPRQTECGGDAAARLLVPVQ